MTEVTFTCYWAARHVSEEARMMVYIRNKTKDREDQMKEAFSWERQVVISCRRGSFEG